MKTNKTNAAAILTIHDAPNMSEDGKRDIAKWLRRQAAFLVKNADQLSTRFTARYLYEDDEGEQT